MSELEDFFAQPIEPQGQGLEEAFASPVSVESESNSTEEIDFLQLGMDMVQSANDGLSKLEAQEPLPDVEQVSKEQGTESLLDSTQMIAQGMAGYKATPGPPALKALGGVASVIPPVNRVVDATVDGTIKDGASQLGTELGVNQEENLKQNLEAARIAPSKIESISKPKPHTMGVDTKTLLQNGIF